MGMSSLVVVLGLIAEVYTIDIRIQALYRRKFNMAKVSGLIGRQQAQAERNKQGNKFMRMHLLDFSKTAEGKDIEMSSTMFRQPNRGQRTEIMLNNIREGRPPVIRDDMVSAITSYGKAVTPDGAAASPDAVKAFAPINAEKDPAKAVALFNKLPENIRAEWYANNLGALKEYEAMGDLLRPKDGNVLTFHPDMAKDPSVNQQLKEGTVAAGTKPGEIWTDANTVLEYTNAYLREIKAMEIEIDQELEILKAQRTALVQQREEFTKYASDGIKMGFKNNYA